jgi:hypothetical protein
MTRTKVVGDCGEGLIEQLLRRVGFDSIRDLNQRRYNHLGGDFLAKREAIEFFISVKGGTNISRMFRESAASMTDTIFILTRCEELPGYIMPSPRG